MSKHVEEKGMAHDPKNHIVSWWRQCNGCIAASGTVSLLFIDAAESNSKMNSEGRRYILSPHIQPNAPKLTRGHLIVQMNND